MFGTIRKHSKWLWAVIITLTIITFVFWGTQTRQFDGGSGNYGRINGVAITRDDFIKARREAELRYFFNRGEWPDHGFDADRETYIQLLFIQKQEDLGIHVSTETVAKGAAERLRMMNRGNPLPLSTFAKQVLQPRGLTVDDFERYFRHELGLQELMTLTAVGGNLVGPEEIRSLYIREHEELSTQAAFFTASNYLDAVSVTSAALAQFYTNRMADYRLPERVQVSYLKFSSSNFLAEVTKQFAEVTNLNEQVEARYASIIAQYGTNAFSDAKTPEEGKQKTKEMLFKNELMAKAHKQANELANHLFELTPFKPETVAAFVKTNGLTLQVSLPFSERTPPKELKVGEDFVKAAFALTSEEPYAGPIAGEDAFYILVINQRLPSENPVFDTVRDEVTADYKFSQASALARQAGDNFYHALTNGLASGKAFVAICAENKVKPVLPPPVSISTRDLPVVEALVPLNQYKQVAFTTKPGKVSSFIPIRSGGFVVFVAAKLPVDEVRLQSDLPNFAKAVRQNRQSEAFNDWFRQEAGRGLRETPLGRPQPQMSGAPGQ